MKGGGRVMDTPSSTTTAGNKLNNIDLLPSPVTAAPSKLIRVTIFGLSANPPTDGSGHSGIVQSLVDSGLYDEVWLLPVYVHIFAAKRNLEAYEHRLEMCSLIGRKLSTDKVLVRPSELERTVYCEHNPAGAMSRGASEVKIGSIDIVRYVRAKLPAYDLLSINLGADSYNDLVNGKWKLSDCLLGEVSVNAYYRAGFDDLLPAPAFARGVTFVQIKVLGSTSSTVVRGAQPSMLADWPFCFARFIAMHKEEVPVFPEVYDYIRREQLYFYSPAALRSRLVRRCSALLMLMLTVALLVFIGYSTRASSDHTD